MKTLIIILSFVALSQALPLEFDSFGEIKNIDKNGKKHVELIINL